MALRRPHTSSSVQHGTLQVNIATGLVDAGQSVPPQFAVVGMLVSHVAIGMAVVPAVPVVPAVEVLPPVPPLAPPVPPPPPPLPAELPASPPPSLSPSSSPPQAPSVSMIVRASARVAQVIVPREAMPPFLLLWCSICGPNSRRKQSLD
jgi:hypothetical protein